MLNQKLLASRFSIAVIHVPCMFDADLYIDYLLYNKETKLYSVPVSIAVAIYKNTYKNDIHNIIPGANVVDYISIDQYYFDQEQWDSWLYEFYYDEWYTSEV